MKIRNYILNAWLKSKPKFVSKTSVRPGLKVFSYGHIRSLSSIISNKMKREPNHCGLSGLW